MAFTPNSTVYLLDTPLDNTYKNQIYFSSSSAQYNYFIGRQKHVENGVTYLRKDNTFRASKHIDDLWNCNYVMYRNSNFGTKWFYGFITEMKFISPSCTEITIETDVYQTWLFECDIKDSFVIREHVMSDEKGTNLVDEGIEYGDYKMRYYEKSGLLDTVSFVIALSDDSPITGSLEPTGNMYGHVYSGLSYYAFPTTSYEGLTDLISAYVLAGKGDAIQFIFTIPSIFLPVTSGKIPSGTNASGQLWNYEYTQNDIDTYIPKNNKLFNFPYNTFYVSNNQGSSATYRFEDFNSVGGVTFAIIGCITPNPNIECCPQGYKGQATYSQEYGLSMGGFPLCSWSNDTFGAWLVQNSISMGVNSLKNAVLASNPITLVGGMNGALNQMVQIAEHSIQPDQAQGNLNGGSLNVASDAQDFYMTHMTIKKEYAKRIDDFLSMYGYKVNTVKVPNVSGRPCWNYVLTNDIEIVGAIPANDMKKLKQMYDSGVTLWKSASYVGDYSLDNTL